MSDDLQQSNLRRLIEEAIKLELNMAKAYLSFHHRFSEDAEFWRKIATEERNHAALLKIGEQCFLDSGIFPSELVDTSLESLINANNELESILLRQKGTPPSRAYAFNFALRFEESVGEIHFQHAMQKTEQSSEAIKILQALNEADKDHANRIRSYMRQHGIAEIP